MTAYIKHNTTESIGIIRTQADDVLTDWVAKLAKEYSPLKVDVFDLGPNAGSDYMSWTKFGYPAAFAAEGNPLHGGFPGDFDPYVHTTEDKMDINDKDGVFSIDVSSPHDTNGMLESIGTDRRSIWLDLPKLPSRLWWSKPAGR